MKEFTKKQKLEFCEYCIERYKTTKGMENDGWSGLVFFGICDYFITENREEKMEVLFPELYKEIAIRKRKRTCVYSFPVNSYKLRINFLNKFKLKFK